MEITVSGWVSNFRTVERGPLVYALKIQREEWKRETMKKPKSEYFSVLSEIRLELCFTAGGCKNPARFKINTKSFPKNFTLN